MSTEMSPLDFQRNLQQYLQIFSEEYLRKQEKVKKELENKQNYLAQLSQTQFNEQRQLNERFQRIKHRFQQLKEQSQQVIFSFVSIICLSFLFFKSNRLVNNVCQRN